MAENKKSFLLYADIIGVVSKLPDEKAGQLFKIILDYVNDKNPEVEDLLLSIAFEPIKLALKRDLIKYESIKESSSENGIIGNLKRWHLDIYNDYTSKKISLNDAISLAEIRKSSPPDNTRSGQVGFIAVNVTDSVNVNDTVIDNVTVKEKKNIKSIEERKKEFSATLSPFLEEFGKDILNAFYYYWSEEEINKKNPKLRFELQKTWSLKGRLNTWKNRDKNFNKNGNQNTNTLKSNNGTYDAKDFGKL